MFSADEEAPVSGVNRYRLRRNGLALTRGDAIALWRGDDDAFRCFFIRLLRDSAFECFRFETPPLTPGSADQPFQFVLARSPEIDMAADERDFRNHFDTRSEDVVVFDNLGGDAVLVVPRPLPGVPGYAHLAGFLKYAPPGQQQRLWRTVGETLHDLLGDSPLWLNTAGGGVPWLHVRIDTRPKYYVFDEYKAGP